MIDVYLVMQQPQGSDDNAFATEISGIFSSEEKAIKACRDNKYVYTKMTLDEQFPDETVNVVEWRWPTRERTDD